MASLGYNVTAHRVGAYAVAGFLAAVGGVLMVWYNGRISPGTVGTGAMINILIIAVLGGMRHPVGAFIGAIVFVLLQNFAIDLVDRERFNLVIGGVFLAIVLFSPDGLLGLWQKAARAPVGEQSHSTAAQTAFINEEQERDNMSNKYGKDIRAEPHRHRRGVRGGRVRGPRAGDLEDRPAGLPRRSVRGTGPGRHARRRSGAEAAQRHGRRQEDRVRQGVVRRHARQGGELDAQGCRAGQGPDHDRPVVGRRGHRGQELREDAAERDLRQRLVGRTGRDARRPGGELLPLQHRGRAMDGGPG